MHFSFRLVCHPKIWRFSLTFFPVRLLPTHKTQQRCARCDTTAHAGNPSSSHLTQRATGSQVSVCRRGVKNLCSIIIIHHAPRVNMLYVFYLSSFCVVVAVVIVDMSCLCGAKMPLDNWGWMKVKNEQTHQSAHWHMFDCGNWCCGAV